VKPLDTNLQALAIRDRVLRRLPPVERLRIAMDMTDTLRDLAMSRLRAEHPQWSDADLRKELLRIALLPTPLPEALR